MDELDPQVIAAIERAAREASDPQLRDRLSAAAAIFAALARRDKREREAWAIVRAVARCSVYHDSHGGMLIVRDPDELVDRARALLSEEGRR